MSNRLDDILNKLKEAFFGPGFLSQYPEENGDGDYLDVPHVPPADYPTHVTSFLPRSKKTGKPGNIVPYPTADSVQEQDEEKEEDLTPPPDELEAPETAPEDAAAAGAEDNIAGTEDMGGEAGMEDPNAMGDMGGDMGGMDTGLGAEEEKKTPGELGKIYELKKIYSRLTSMESYLSDESDKELLEIRIVVSQAIELFEVISANIDSYKDRINDIIIMYYKFLKEVYAQVKDIYKRLAKENEE